MAFSVELPYFKPSGLCPAPLPSTAKIEASTCFIKNEPYSTSKIVRVGQHYVVKYGETVDAIEGKNLLFIEQHLDIPVPRLFALYREGQKVYIIMEYLSGESLEKVWPTLSCAEKVHIAQKLRGVFDALRALPSPKFFGDVSQRGLPNTLFWSKDENTAISGPFSDEAALNQGMVKQMRKVAAEGSVRSTTITDFFEDNLPRVLNSNSPRFTHADVQKKNILARELATKCQNGERQFDIGIVDWESGGWYPDYWEYTAAFLAVEWDDDWPRKVELFLDPYPAEAVMLKLVHQCVFGF